MSTAGRTAYTNARTMQALGIRSIKWQENRRTESDWLVTLETDEQLIVTTHILGTERSVLLEVALLLSERKHPVQYVSAVGS